MDILQLGITKEEQGRYEWHLSDGNNLLVEPDVCASIVECIKEALKSLPDDIAALEIYYRAISVGTFSVAAIRGNSSSVADKVVARYAEAVEGMSEYR